MKYDRAKKVAFYTSATIVGVFSPLVVFAQDNYVLISRLGSRTDVDLTGGGGLNAYIGDLFTIFIVIATVLAVIRLMICGIQYMTTEGTSSKGTARECLSYVIGGLLLILASFLILQTINSDLAQEDVASGLWGRITSNPGDAPTGN